MSTHRGSSRRSFVFLLLSVSFTFVASSTSMRAGAIGDFLENRRMQERSSKLLGKLQSDETEVARMAASELIELCKQYEEGQPIRDYGSWMSQVFRLSPDVDQRKNAFAFLKKHSPYELEGVTRTIEIATPNYPCVGAFQDSVRKVLHAEFDDVWLVTITRRTLNDTDRWTREAFLGRQRPPSELILNVTVSSDRTEREILECLANSDRYDMKSWSVFIRAGVMDLLSKEASK
ncbi:MAG: hypothetical protein AAF802_18285 [Planctomycetota bacterium]